MFDFDILVKDPKGSIDFNVRSNDSFETFSSFQFGEIIEGFGTSKRYQGKKYDCMNISNIYLGILFTIISSNGYLVASPPQKNSPFGHSSGGDI